MVKIAIAGGSGRTSPLVYIELPCMTNFNITEVAQEVIDALLVSGKHEIVILSRKVQKTIEFPTLWSLHTNSYHT